MRLIVVGSGIVGASCAYAATSLGAEVVLVDAARPGRATAAGAGIICPWSAPVTDPAWCALAYAAAREYPALMARLADLGETDVSYRQVGALALAADEEDRERIRLALTARRAEAPEIGEVTGLSGAEARQLFPPLRADAAAVHIGGAARVDGRELAAALARAAARQGAVVRQDQAQLALDHGRVTGSGSAASSSEQTRSWPPPAHGPGISWPTARIWKPGSASARWALGSGRCSGRYPPLTAWSSPPAWAPPG